MVGTIAQKIAIVSHGNESLLTDKINDIFLENTTFQFCKAVNFIGLYDIKENKKSKGYLIASNSNEWFKFLKKENCKKLKLFYLRPKKSESFEVYKIAGFIGGGGTWLIEAVYDGYSDFWTSKWKVTDKKANDRKIWTVYYSKIDFHKALKTKKDDIDKIEAEFSNVLYELIEFSHLKNLSRFEVIFKTAQKTLDSLTPDEHYYHKDLVVKANYKLIARQLLFSAGISWVFGGMGSWNDLGFSDKKDNETYNDLSKKLYDIICKSILASINSY